MAEQKVLRYVFGGKATAKGYTVWLVCPSGRRVVQRFRTKGIGQSTCARLWVQSQCRDLQYNAALNNYRVEFEIPEELSSVTESRTVTLPIAVWDAIDAVAQHQGVSSWLLDATQAALSKESSR